jgi:hypothetical protein
MSYSVSASKPLGEQAVSLVALGLSTLPYNLGQVHQMLTTSVTTRAREDRRNKT